MFPERLLTTGWVQFSLAIAAGLLTNLAFEPFGLAVAVFLTLTVLFRLWSTVSAARAAGLGFLFALGFYGVGINWVYISVHDFGAASPVLAGSAVILLACIMSLFVALTGYLQAKFSVSPAIRYLALIPSLWTLAEWTRGWLFSGFPWLYVGYSQTDTWLAGWAPLTSVLGVSFAVCTLAGAIVLLGRGVRPVPIGVAALVLFVGITVSRIDWTDERLSPVSVAMIQGDVSVLEKWNRENAIKLLGYFVRESEAINDVDLIVWPEIALPYRDTYLRRIRLWDALRQHPSDFLVGTLEERTEDGKTLIHNSAYGISDDGVQKYRKSRLVPFGEYTPFRRLLGWLKEFVVLPASDMTPFTDSQPLLRLAGQTLGVTICYEDAFPLDVRKSLPSATYLVNISEDAWFGDRLAPHQRLQMSRMRAIETARPVIRAANKGISASIDHLGQVIDSLEQARGKVLKSTIIPTTGSTPFVRYGFVPILILCTGLTALSIFLSRRRRKD